MIESEIASVGDVNYEEIDLPPFKLENYASLNEKLMNG